MGGSLKVEAVGKISVAQKGGRRGASLVLPVCPPLRLDRVDRMRLNLNGRNLVSWRSSGIYSQLPGGPTIGTTVPSQRCLARRTICHHSRHSPVRGSIPSAVPAVPTVQQQRGAKTKSTVKLKDLPQGVLKLESYDDGADDVPQYPTVVQGHRNNMQKFKNCVVLTRVGGFYEV